MHGEARSRGYARSFGSENKVSRFNDKISCRHPANGAQFECQVGRFFDPWIKSRESRCGGFAELIYSTGCVKSIKETARRSRKDDLSPGLQHFCARNVCEQHFGGRASDRREVAGRGRFYFEGQWHRTGKTFFQGFAPVILLRHRSTIYTKHRNPFNEKNSFCQRFQSPQSNTGQNLQEANLEGKRIKLTVRELSYLNGTIGR